MLSHHKTKLTQIKQHKQIKPKENTKSATLLNCKPNQHTKTKAQHPTVNKQSNNTN